jgi:hypothetical protein
MPFVGPVEFENPSRPGMDGYMPGVGAGMSMLPRRRNGEFAGAPESSNERMTLLLLR